MKKLFVFIFAFLLSINVFPSNAYAITATNEIGMEEFYSQLDEIILSCDNAIGSTDNIEDIPTNRLIVKTETDTPLENYYDAVYVAEGYDGLHILQFVDDIDTKYAYNKLQSDNIEYVEYDYFLKISDITQNTETAEEAPPKYSAWNSLAVNVGNAIDYIGNNGVICDTVTVAVIDTGIYAAHTHFKNPERIVNNQKYTFGSKKLDKEGNKVTVQESSLEDKCFHGTAVSSVIYDNSMDNVIIEPYRISDSISMSYSLMFKAFDFAAKNNVDIINISAEGGIPENSKTLFNMISDAVKQGIVVVVAAGNFNKSTETVFPACHPDVITVSNTDSNSVPHGSSNFGNAVDIAAPGTNILCPTPRTFNDKDKNSVESCDSYSTQMTLTGTSYSAPLVAAATALIKSIDPDITPEEVKQIIKDTAYVPDNWEESCDGKNYGTGIVNFYNIAKVMVRETSVTPTIRINSDQKFEITVPEGSDAEVFYTLNSSFPTLENHLTYTEPLNLRYKNAPSVMAACYKDGRLIGRTAIYGLVTYDEKSVFYKWSGTLTTNKDTSNAKWRSYNPNIASVDSDGNIKGVSIGNTLITCSLPTGERIIWKVNVKYSPLQAFFVLFFFGFLWI